MTSRVILWDSGEKHTDKHYDFRPYKNRAAWKHVPCGTTDYAFVGSPVIENDFFYIYFHASSHDSIFLYAKRNGEPSIWVNELYKVYAPAFARRRNYGGGAAYTKILKNSPSEVVVESGSIPFEREGEIISVVTTYRVVSDRPWVQVRPVRTATEQGIHGKVRMGLAPVEGGNDFVVDSLRDPGGRPKAPPTRMLLCFYENREFPFVWVLTWSAAFEQAAPWFFNDSGPKGDTMWAAPGEWGNLVIPRSWPGCITSTWAGFGEGGSVVVGALTYPNTWHREQVDRSIKAGENYASSWKPPYPGRWRLTARVAKRRYDQGFDYDGITEFKAQYFSADVYDGKFTFISPFDGHLDYLIMYLYDRTAETPAEVQTPMDQHRWTVSQGEQEL